MKQNTYPGVVVNNTSNGKFLLVRRWDRWIAVILCIVCMGFLLIVFFSLRKYPEEYFSKTYFKIFALAPLVMIFIWLVYIVLAHVFNSSYISIIDDDIRIRHRPFWWPGRKYFRTSQITRLYCRIDGKESKPGYLYKIIAVLDNGKQTAFLSSILKLDEALYIRNAIEEHLKKNAVRQNC